LRQVVGRGIGIGKIAEHQRLHECGTVAFRLPLHKTTGTTGLFHFVRQHLVHRLRNLVDNGHGNSLSVVHLLQFSCMHDARNKYSHSRGS
jgi:hypothetical protein